MIIRLYEHKMIVYTTMILQNLRVSPCNGHIFTVQKKLPYRFHAGTWVKHETFSLTKINLQTKDLHTI